MELNSKLHIIENKKNTTFVTTAIDYPNALPHIGTAFEKIGADVYARFRRSQGREVYFLMGNDENTIKVQQAAQKADMENIVYVTNMASAFKSVWHQLNIFYDDFIQTTEERHKIGVQHFLNVVNSAGFIEKRQYKSLYCEGCEEFKTISSLINGRCINHQYVNLIEREEENYFFLLSKFKKWILDYITLVPFSKMFLSIEPQSRQNEVENFVKTELKDVSISRKNEGWGIPIPWDESQVTYVWFDALLSYLTGVGFGTDWEKFEKFWPAEVHFIGKDITRFHCALFPAMIEAYNTIAEKKIHPPIRVFAHGFIYQKKGKEYVKSSKSGDAFNPVDLINKFGTDAYRYYFLSRCNYNTDGEFSLESFQEVYNSDLANGIGNLVSRIHQMESNFGQLPVINIHEKTLWITSEKLNHYEEFILANCSFHHALELIRDIVFQANQYIDQMKPWGIKDKDLLALVLYKLVGNTRIISLLLKPFIPDTSKKIYNAFKWGISWSDTSWETLQKLAENNFWAIENSIEVNEKKIQALFPRIK